jgi:hypothetical protein
MFTVSKLLSAITQPMFWLAVWWGMALIFVARGWKGAVRMLWLGLLLLGLLGFRAIPDGLLRALESRFSVPAASGSRGV